MRKLFLLMFVIFMFSIMAIPAMAKQSPGLSIDIVFQAVDRHAIDGTTFIDYKIFETKAVPGWLNKDTASRITPTFHVGKINYS